MADLDGGGDALDRLRKAASNKFRVKAKRLFHLHTGEELDAKMMEKLYEARRKPGFTLTVAVSRGEDFVGEVKKTLTTPTSDNAIPTVHIDGATLEGGGQIIRQSTALSAILGQPIAIHNIRANRKTPGLAAQHLAGVRLVSTMSESLIGGDSLRSTEIALTPPPRSEGKQVGKEEKSAKADVGTAGSITLLVQSSLPVAVMSGSSWKLDLKGGTDVGMSPAWNYLTDVTLPTLRKHLGIQVEATCHRRGYYPKGGGHVSLSIEPVKELPGINLVDFGKIAKVTGRVTSSGLPEGVPERIRRSAVDAVEATLKKLGYGQSVSVDVTIHHDAKAFGSGGSIVLVAETETGCYLGGSAVAERELKSEKVGEIAAASLSQSLVHGYCVDEHLQDQLIIFMALSSLPSRIKTGSPTLHTRTAIHFAEKLTGASFTITPIAKADGERADAEDDGAAGSLFIIECTGSRGSPSKQASEHNIVSNTIDPDRDIEQDDESKKSGTNGGPAETENDAPITSINDVDGGVLGSAARLPQRPRRTRARR
uniref:RNA 3'-terminal-phosphate cyclase (ATP) n=1 Tax=Lotharella globosa TaxID=91324 RepID=A0A7S3YAG2_9EUKA